MGVRDSRREPTRERSWLERRKNLFVARRVRHWSRLPRQAARSPSSGVFKSKFALEDKALSSPV